MFQVIQKQKPVSFYYDEDSLSGVCKIADKVRDDLRKVSGNEAKVICAAKGAGDISELVYFGTINQNKKLMQWEEAGLLDLSGVTGKREVYGYYLLENISFEAEDGKAFLAKKVLVIAGSDKRGTIYGLFHLSDLLGVSAFVNWSLVTPPSKSEFALKAQDLVISKQPSVEYRGFFINDEWPAFGNFAMKRFGGVNAVLYEQVFELLLRLKGNYLWPAMWASNFAMDGPGLKSAKLADELGVVMGLSHHEPCLRHGEEYSMVRGKDSIYGDAWNFRSNPDGITRFWEDGLKRNGHLENVITIGMRGERDSSIMGESATLKDNIDLLKDVITTQHRLIRENVNEDLDQVPRMLALYKEVEPFYYGDENAEGLCDWEELSDVILMLCDDNHGYLRTLPTEKMRGHKGGFGMYYHFDYHGDPVSFEWTASTYLPVVWEEMTTAYEYGINKLWIVNVGDLGLQEFPLNYFMDLAYDYDTYGISAPNQTESYTQNWMQKQFGAFFKPEDVIKMSSLMTEYTRISHNRRPEHLGDRVYHPAYENEANEMLERIDSIITECDRLKEVSSEIYPAFYELFYYNTAATMNLHKIWIYTTLNHYFSERGLVVANTYRDLALEALKKDLAYTQQLHEIGDGHFYGLGMAPHVGFTKWNKEMKKNPVLHTVLPVDSNMLIAGFLEETEYTSGEEWTGKPLVSNALLNPHTKEVSFYVGCVSDVDMAYEIVNENPFLKVTRNEGSADEELKAVSCIKDPYHVWTITLQGEIPADLSETVLYIRAAETNVVLKLKLTQEKAASAHTLYDGVLAIEASDFNEKKDVEKGAYEKLDKLGRDTDGMKIFPVTADFRNVAYSDRPYLCYEFDSQTESNGSVSFYIEPTNPVYNDVIMELAFSINDTAHSRISTNEYLCQDYTVGVSEQWEQGVLDHIRVITSQIQIQKGRNILKFYATCPNIILDKIVIQTEDHKCRDSYLGPRTEKR